MDKKTFSMLEGYMRSCMDDSAHDTQHVYRVLYNALELARDEKVDHDILITACLLHDIGRVDQFADPSLCHAQVGADKAHAYLTGQGFSKEFADQVAHCIRSHRFRKSCQPETIEAKILFDADKLDVTGAVGIARTLMYKGDQVEPLYIRQLDGGISNGEGDDVSSFFREYKFKLERLYDRFLTAEGARLAENRRLAAVQFYEALYREVNETDKSGKAGLNKLLEE